MKARLGPFIEKWLHRIAGPKVFAAQALLTSVFKRITVTILFG